MALLIVSGVNDLVTFQNSVTLLIVSGVNDLVTFQSSVALEQ